MTATNNSAAILPPIRVQDIDQQVRSLLGATFAWVGSHWLQVIIATAVASVIVVALHFVRRIAQKYSERHEDAASWPAILARAVVKTGNVFMVMAAAKIVTAANFAATPVEVSATINLLWTVAAWFQVAIWLREIILGAIEHRTESDSYSGEALTSAMSIIRLLVTFAVFAVAFVVVLDNLGVNVTGLVAGLGVGGIAIGLAAQGIFADLFAALAIIFDRPFHRGDTISYDSTLGTVESIGLKSTRIRAATGEERIIANKSLLDKEIQNITRREYRRVVFTLGLVQWTPVAAMEQLPTMLKEVVEAAGHKFVRAGFLKFGESSYDFDVEFDSENAAFAQFFDARHVVGIGIIRRLNEAGIELAYPVQTGFTAAPEGGLIQPYPEAPMRGTVADSNATAAAGTASPSSPHRTEG